MKISYLKSVAFAIFVASGFLQAHSGEKVFECNFKDDISNWKNYANRGTFSIAEDGSLQIVSQRKGGVCREIKVQPNNMYNVSVEVKGTGKFQASLHGSNGLAYSTETTLSESDWKKIELSYFAKSSSLKLYLYSSSDSPETLYVKSVLFETAEMSELKDCEIPCIKLEAEKYPGSNGKVKKDEQVSGGAYASGGKWYRIASVPMPLTSKALYVNLKIFVDIKGTCSIRACRGKQTLQEVSVKESGKWHWMQLGPLDVRAIGQTLDISQVSAPDTELKIDKIVITTNKDFETAEMEKE